MKLLKIIPILSWGLLGARGGYAQTAQEQKFLATTDSLYEQLNEYMAKNLYYIESWTHYGFNTETTGHQLNYIFLQPTGCDSSQRRARNFSVNDDDYFWQAPQ